MTLARLVALVVGYALLWAGFGALAHAMWMEWRHDCLPHHAPGQCGQDSPARMWRPR